MNRVLLVVCMLSVALNAFFIAGPSGDVQEGAEAIEAQQQLQARLDKLSELNAELEEELKVAKLDLMDAAAAQRRAPDVARGNSAEQATRSERVSASTAARKSKLPAVNKEFVDRFATRSVSAIEKFFPLSEDQKGRIMERQRARFSGEEPSESLEDIIGKDNASFYREMRRKSFEKARSESREKELYFMSRKLRLDPYQEEQVSTLLRDVDSKVRKAMQEEKEELGESDDQKRPRWVDYQRKRREIIAREFEGILTPEQMEQYAEIDANSAGAEAELWH